MAEKLTESVTVKFTASQLAMLERFSLLDETTISEVIRQSVAARVRVEESRYQAMKRIFEPVGTTDKEINA